MGERAASVSGPEEREGSSGGRNADGTSLSPEWDESAERGGTTVGRGRKERSSASRPTVLVCRRHSLRPLGRLSLRSRAVHVKGSYCATEEGDLS